MDSEENKSYKPNTPTHSHLNHFKTPEEVAAQTLKTNDNLGNKLPSGDKPQGLTLKKLHKHLWNKFQDLPTRRKIIMVVIVVVVLGSIGTVVALATSGKKKVPAAPAVIQVLKAKPSKPVITTVASDLTGLQVSPGDNSRPVTGVMIENSDAARPQSGLIDAGVVFEAIAEGGVTRFLALYQDSQPSSLGPVRSVRPYFLGWDLGFDAPIAHVGGSPDALNDISTWGAKDLDEFYNGGYYQRVSSRQAPHNVYTSASELNALEASKGYNGSTFSGFPRKADQPSKQPTATSIDLTLSGYDYNAHYDYDSATNSYNRSEGGSAHTDEQTGAKISPKVVVAIVVPLSQGALDASGAYYSVYAYLGSGTVDVFQDGTVTTGTWQKNSNNVQITFSDSNNNPIKLNAGQTWITAVATQSDISYK